MPVPRVDIQQIDPQKLDAIRKQWKSREKALLLDKGSNYSKRQDG